MPRKRNNTEPPPVMTWGRATPFLAVSIVFDLLRLMFSSFLFFGPALATVYCTAKLGDTITTWTIGLLGTKTAAALCGSSATVVGVVGAPAFIAFGVVMAMAVGFAGWLTIGILLSIFNRRLIRDNSLWFAGSLLFSEVPILGAIPAISIALWRMYGTQIKKDRELLQKFETQQAASEQRERQQQMTQALQQESLNKEWSERAAQQEAADEEENTLSETVNDKSVEVSTSNVIPFPSERTRGSAENISPERWKRAA